MKLTVWAHLQAPFQGRVLTDEMQACKKPMSSVRVSVEWMFGNITKYFGFIDFKRQMKLNVSAIGKMYVASALFENARTSLYTKEFIAQANDRFDEI